MRINSINPFLISSPVAALNYQNSFSKVKFTGLNEDVFEKKPKNTDFNVPFGVDKSILKKPKLFLKPKVARYKRDILEAAYETAKLTKVLKKLLDEDYTKDNWVFVSIGTSPALIGHGLELLGVDVRYVPISGIRFLRPEETSPKRVKEAMGKNYTEYLNSIGLNKESVDKDKRKYILCDYTASGKSLKFAEYTAKNVLGIDEDKIETVSLNKHLYSHISKNGPAKLYDIFQNYKSNYLACQEAEKYCSIPHADYKKLHDFDLNKAKLIGASHTSKQFDEALRCYL